MGHGYMYSEQAVRDHAEMVGRSVIIGHLHRVEVRPARMLAWAKGYSIGWLGAEDSAAYAKARRATCAWSNGFAFGEYQAGGSTCVQIVERPKGGEWRLP
jgi:hypothetical protein